MSAAVTSLRSNVSGLARVVPNWAWAIVFLALAVFWPQICETFFDLDLLDASINSLGYIIMALGLNIVVGFAAERELGYVAFYAIGAFVMGWLGSAHFANADIHIGPSEVAKRLPAIHIRFPKIQIAAPHFTSSKINSAP